MTSADRVALQIGRAAILVANLETKLEELHAENESLRAELKAARSGEVKDEFSESAPDDHDYGGAA